LYKLQKLTSFMSREQDWKMTINHFEKQLNVNGVCLFKTSCNHLSKATGQLQQVTCHNEVRRWAALESDKTLCLLL
jgi:hypothetical protein